MRKYTVLQTLALILLLSAVFYGCAKDSTYGGDKTVDMQLALDTYAVGDDPNASSDNEELIKSAWVYIFNENGVLENPGKTAVPVASSGEAADGNGRLNHTWRVTVGPKDIYVLLNAGRLTREGRVVDLDTYNPFSKAELESLITDPTAFAADFPASGNAGMLMSGKLGTTVSAATSLVSVPVARRYARIDLNLRRKADLTGAAVVVKSTTLKNRREKAYVLAPVTESTGDDVVYLNDHGDVAVGASLTDYTAVTSFYTMPRTGASKAACLELVVGIDGRDYTLPVYLNRGALGGGTGNNENLPLDISANKVYKVDVSIERQSFTIAMEILEWNETSVNGDVNGSSLALDSVVLVRASRETLVPVLTKADSVYARLTSQAVNVGYILHGADVDGVLGVKAVNGKAEIPITGPAAYPVGTMYGMTVMAGNIRRNALLRVDGTPVLEVADETIEFPYSGGYKNYQVTSCIDLGDEAGTLARVPWTAEFSLDDGSSWSSIQPTCMQQFTASHAGSTAPASFGVRLEMTPGVNRSTSSTNLREADPANNLDLSMVDGSRNTANCYLVNASGTYTFPLVYGNAVKGGGPNISAYTSTQSGENILPRFVNHLDNEIDDPYIYRNTDCAPADAIVVWQDVSGLVQNVALTADKQNISFEVPRSTIQQGNTIVAVRDTAGKIMWSWHIWVTDYVLGTDVKKVTNFGGVQYDFLPVNLGWCEGKTIDYDSRKILVRLTQPTTGQNVVFVLDQLSGTATFPGNNTYYQWGRKDPMLPGLRNNGVTSSKSHYSDTGYRFTMYEGGVSIGTSILNPHAFYKASANWCDEGYFNIWSANNTVTNYNDNPVVKTIYDPSPAGYCLPPSNGFTGATSHGAGANGDYFGSRFNSPYTAETDVTDNFCWEFYCNKMVGEGSYDIAGGTILYPLTGSRNQTGTGWYAGERSFCWTALPASADYGRNATFQPLYIGTTNSSYKACAYSVRPVREK
ncbi:hypothetical protein [Alistipes provencensis]|uniref:hypothetical protein n=1 Tax=Alistipes provencensis TaxID=1816676 RepID=UPI000A9A6251|nr:hypothetical protein [Alistipes provencensis]